jgi:hypothetical protein
MLEFIRKLFRPANKATHRRRPIRLTLEAFESRDLLNASPLYAGFHMPSMSDHSQSASVHAGSSDSSRGCHDNNQSQTLTASLTGATGTSGTATLKSDTSSGDNSLVVQVSGLAASSTFTVTSGTTTLGTITTDANGSGKLSVTNLSPTLAAGADITVVDANEATVLTGTLADPNAKTHLSASLTGATGTSGKAHFHSNAETGDNRLGVHVFSLTADATYDVQVDGTTVGQITTDDHGSGALSLSNVSMTIAANSVVTVLDSQGTTVLQGTFS